VYHFVEPNVTYGSKAGTAATTNLSQSGARDITGEADIDPLVYKFANKYNTYSQRKNKDIA
jgi:hypothetical protein